MEMEVQKKTPLCIEWWNLYQAESAFVQKNVDFLGSCVQRISEKRETNQFLKRQKKAPASYSTSSLMAEAMSVTTCSD
jgi:hypothetical protein